MKGEELDCARGLVVLYVGKCCPFSPAALTRVERVIRSYPRLRLVVRNVDEAPQHGDSVVVTPTVVFPNGTRMAGVPEPARLRAVFAELAGTDATVPNKVWYLEQSRLFKGVPLEEIERMAHLFREYDYPARQIVFGEGDLGDTIYLLKTGHVRLYRLTEDGKEITLAILGPGDVFGELALFDETKRTTFAETLDATHVCATSIEEFNQLMLHRPQLTMMVAREVARRRAEAETRIAGTTYASVRGRLIAVLQHLLAEHGEPLPGGGRRISVWLSHQELASLAGTSRETCTVEMGNLQRAGLIAVDQERYIVVPKPERLQPGPLDRIVHGIVAGNAGASAPATRTRRESS